MFFAGRTIADPGSAVPVWPEAWSYNDVRVPVTSSQRAHRKRQLGPNFDARVWCNGQRKSNGSRFDAGAILTDCFTIEMPGNVSGDARNDLPRDFAGSSARVFRLGGQWYFSTREGDIGPFRTREQAKREASAHHTVLKPR